MDPIRVFVIDDHPMIRHGLAAMLAAERDMAWVGAAADGAEALRNAPPLRPDVLLVDMVMPQMDGVATISALRPLLPKARFLVLATLHDPAELRRATAAGAWGHLMKSASTQDLLGAIHGAHRGQRVSTPDGVDAQATGERTTPPGADLTQRERELLALMARGLSNQDISTALNIAMPTVKFHVTNILAKLRSDNRTEAVLVALRHKLVRLE